MTVNSSNTSTAVNMMIGSTENIIEVHKPQEQENQGTFCEKTGNMEFPKTEETANVSDLGGVGNLKVIVGAGPVDEKGDVYDMHTTAGLHKVVQKSVEGVEVQFRNLVRADDKIAALDKLIKGLPNESDRQRYDEGLEDLKKLGARVNFAAKKLTKILSGDANAVRLGIVDQQKETEDQRETRLLTEIDNMRVSLRNFRSDFDEIIYRKEGFLAGASRAWHTVRNFFTTTRNRFFARLSGGQEQQYVSEASRDEFSKAMDDFGKKYQSLVDSLQDEHPIMPPDIPVTTHERIDDYLHSVAEMIEAKSEDSFANMCVRSVKDQLRNIAENGGYKLMELEIGVGYGFRILNKVDATVGGKGKYLYKVFGSGDGSVTIEHVGQVGVDAHAKWQVGETFQLEGRAQGNLGGGKSFQYRDLDAAARSMITSAGKESKSAKFFSTRINPLFVKGRGVGTNVKFGLKYVFVGLPWLAILGVGKGIDALHRLRTGRHLFDTFDPDKQFRDRAYFDSLKERKVFRTADKLLTPRKNVLLTGKRSFGRGGGGADGNLKLHPAFMRLRVDGTIDVSRDFNAKKTDYRTYMTYLTHEQNGECKERLLDMKPYVFPFGNRADSIQQQGDMREDGNGLAEDIVKVLSADVQDYDGGAKAVAKKILDLLQRVIEAEDEYGVAFEERPEEIQRAKYEEAAEDYRLAMRTVAALLERYDELNVGDDANLRESYEKLRETAMSNLENPAVHFPEKTFQDKFFVQHTTSDGKVVTKGEFFLEYDALGDAKSMMLGNTKLSDPSKSLNIGKTVGRAGAIGAVEGGSKALGMEGFAGLTVTTVTPKATDKKAPWLGKTHKTYDIQFSANVTFDLVMRSVMLSMCIEANIPPPKHGDWKEILKNQLSGVVSSSLKRAFFDLWAKFGGGDPNSSIAESDRFFVNSGKDVSKSPWPTALDFWRSGRTVQLEFFDGRLSAVNFGDGDKLLFKLGVQAGPVVIHGSYRSESLENKHSFWMHPSYDALLNKCDSFLSQGNRSMWKMFVQRNQAGIVRMADIYAQCVGERNEASGDKNEEDDLTRIDGMRNKISNFFESDDYSRLPPQAKERLERNRQKLKEAEEVLRLASQIGGDQKKMLAMRTVLELTVRHFDILQSKEEGQLGQFA